MTLSRTPPKKKKKKTRFKLSDPTECQDPRRPGQAYHASKYEQSSPVTYVHVSASHSTILWNPMTLFTIKNPDGFPSFFAQTHQKRKKWREMLSLHRGMFQHFASSLSSSCSSSSLFTQSPPATTTTTPSEKAYFSSRVSDQEGSRRINASGGAKTPPYTTEPPPEYTTKLHHTLSLHFPFKI